MSHKWCFYFLLLVLFAGLCFAKSIDNLSTVNLRLLFNAKEGKIWQMGIDLLDEPKALTNTTVATEICHYNSTSVDRANIVDFDYDTWRNRVMWLSWNERLYATNNSEKPVDELLLWYDYYDFVQFSSKKIAVDPVNEKLYSIDVFLNPTVEVVDFAGKHRSILFGFEAAGEAEDHVFVGMMPLELETSTNAGILNIQEYPVEIVVDPYEGFLFIRTTVNYTTRIHRANMDGTSLKLVIFNAGKNKKDQSRLDVDRTYKRIYWNDYEKSIIESADYEGTDRLIVVQAANPLALVIHNDHLFWSQNVTDSALRTHIKVCKLTDNICKTDQIRDILPKGMKEVPYKIKAIEVSSSHRTASNPCKVNNGGCQHLCLLKHSPTSKINPVHSCACKIGYRLASNSKDCLPILKYLIYTSNNFIKGKTLEPSTENNINNNFPAQYVSGLVERDQLAAIDYNPVSGKLLYMECRNLVQLDLDQNLRGCWSIVRNQSDCYKHLAYDWQAGKIYTTKLQANNSEYILGVVDVPSSFKRQAGVKPEILRSIERPLSLVVHPKTGYLYLLTQDGDKSVLTRMTSGGYNATSLNVAGAEKARGLAIDNHKNELYWFTDSNEIGHSNLNGADVKMLTVKSPVTKTDSMLLDEEWIYLKNRKSIWRMRKQAGDQASCIVPEMENTKLNSVMRILQRTPDHLYYGNDYQITKAACHVFCTYKDKVNKENTNPDAKFCKCAKVSDN